MAVRGVILIRDGTAWGPTSAMLVQGSREEEEEEGTNVDVQS